MFEKIATPATSASSSESSLPPSNHERGNVKQRERYDRDRKPQGRKENENNPPPPAHSTAFSSRLLQQRKHQRKTRGSANVVPRPSGRLQRSAYTLLNRRSKRRSTEPRVGRAAATTAAALRLIRNGCIIFKLNLPINI